ncbi:MAG: hypothetical protein AVO38_00950 [delta proteobacterium ML8_D]|nr:MAG: hypothetical protein AVO38_00950 [delta proteobacterium ML8_D]
MLFKKTIASEPPLSKKDRAIKALIQACYFHHLFFVLIAALENFIHPPQLNIRIISVKLYPL